MSKSPGHFRAWLWAFVVGGFLCVRPIAPSYAEQPVASLGPTTFILSDSDLRVSQELGHEKTSDESDKAHDRLHGKLRPLMYAYERGGREASRTFAAQHLLPIHDDRVTVIIVPTAGTAPRNVANMLRSRGVSVVRVGKDHLKAEVPVGLLRRLATEEQTIKFIQLPIVPKPDVVSEGVALTNAVNRQLCYTGRGVKVAVIDGGFIGLAAAQAAGELPADAIALDLSGTGLETDTVHGTGVAEIVHDMAPDAQLYLIKIGDSSDLQAAKDYCIAQGVRVVNHSMGWYGTNFYDGVAYSSVGPSPVAIANDAAANGILWVNSAGNDHQAHWLGAWTDSNGNSWLEWSGSSEVNQIGYLSAGTVVVLHLVWNNWPITDQDYDLYLYRWGGNKWTVVASSLNDQTGSQPPTEYIGVQVSSTGYYAAAVGKYNASASNSQFILRSWYQNIQYYSSAGSIGCPADSALVLAVGAMDWNVYPSGSAEGFSARGPTNGAYTGQPVLTKPDLCGPDRVSTVAYGTYPSGFGGTSASSPHLAGAAALVFEQFPEYTAAQVRAFLESQVLDLGDTGKDNIYGYGPLVFENLPDGDGDSWFNCLDNCPNVSNSAQTDVDGDGLGDVCDACPHDPTDMDTDGDGVCNDGDGSGVAGDNPCTGGVTQNCDDNCPNTWNPDQADTNGNGVGDACDICGPPMIIEARSIKTHGAAGDFAINILAPQAIEPRLNGPDRIEIVFDRSIQPADGTLDSEVALSSGAAALSLASTYGPADTLMITLNNAPDENNCLVIQVSGLADAAVPTPSPAMCLMELATLTITLVQGEVNLQPPVNTLDLSITKGQLFQPVTSGNFIFDVTADGFINTLDLSQIKANMFQSALCN